VIRSFRDRRTREFFENGTDRRLPPALALRARVKLDLLAEASSLEDLRNPAGNRLHRVHGDREGQYAIAVNLKWRICFRWEDGEAHDVELCDYH
jgi:proteic killer suppression protein